MTRAASYARVSTDDQAREGYSLESQRQLAADRAEADGRELRPEHAYVDAGMSGSRSDRPAYQAMLAAAAAGHFDALYVWKFDRLGRDAEELLRARRMLEGAGVRLVSLTEGDAEGTLIYGVRALVAQEEREKIAERTRVALRARAKGGHYHGGRVPYGYRAERSGGERGTLIVAPSEAAVVRRIYGEYLGGSGYPSIAERLNDDGVPSPSGRRWDKSQVANMLRSPYYVGRVHINGETFEANHEPIIDAVRWEETQRLRAARAAASGGGRGRNPKGQHLLVRGLLRCTCGGAMSPRTLRSGYQLYRCLTRNGAGGYKLCQQHDIERELIDGAVLDYFESVGLDLDATREQIEQANACSVDEARALRDQAEGDAQRLDAETVRIRRDYRDGKLDADDWRGFRDELDAERRALASHIEMLRRREAEAEQVAAAVDAEAETLLRLAELRAAVAGRIESAENIGTIRGALTTIFESFELKRWSDDDAPEVAHLELCFPDDYVLVPRLRADAVIGYEVSTGDRDVTLPTVRRIPLQSEGKKSENTSALSAGTNALLKFGATPLTAAGDVLASFGIEPPSVSDAESPLLELLPATADELVRRTGRGAAEVARDLVELELAGDVVARDGVYRALT
jgi:site-specific DNA recombinase